MRRAINRLKALSARDKVYAVIVFLVLLGLAVLICMLSPLNIWENGEAGTDSSVFKTVALYIENGLMPYADTFDHKGPLIYIINWLGNKINYYQGVWLLEIVSLFITFVFLYKIARFFCGRLFAIGTLLIVIAPLSGYFEGGNFTEEYALPFIASSLYIFADYFLNDKINNLRLCICGLGLGAVLLLRPNMIAVWVVFCLAVLVRILKDKNYKAIINYLAFFILGMLVIILPIAVWLGANGALKDIIQSYLLFNSQYVSVYAGASLSLTSKAYAFYTFLKNIFMLCSVVCSGVMVWKKRDIFHITYFLCIIVSLLFVSMSGYTYGHYGMILIPLEVYPLSMLMLEIEQMLKNRHISIVMILCCFFIAKSMIPSWLWICSSAADAIVGAGNSSISEKTEQTVEIVEEYSSVGDTITVMGNWDIIYVLTQRLSASRYSYQSPISSVNVEIIDEYFDDLEEARPAVIIITSVYSAGDEQYDRMMDFIEEYDYELLTDEIEDLLIYVQDQ